MNGAGAPVELKTFERIVFFCGAGLSAESGIPTYRGAGGIWGKYRYEEYACQRAFDRNPGKVWDFHDERRRFVAGCEPNPGHHVIARVQARKPDTRIITQNIDGMLQRAGARDVIELHGSLWQVRCDWEGTVKNDVDVPIQSRTCRCGATLRPDIVWFDDSLDPHVVRAAIDAMTTADLLVTIGTSGEVFPAAQLPFIAMERGIPSIEINPEETPMSRLYRYVMRGPASSMLERLDYTG